MTFPQMLTSAVAALAITVSAAGSGFALPRSAPGGASESLIVHVQMVPKSEHKRDANSASFKRRFVKQDDGKLMSRIQNSKGYWEVCDYSGYCHYCYNGAGAC